MLELLLHLRVLGLQSGKVYSIALCDQLCCSAVGTRRPVPCLRGADRCRGGRPPELLVSSGLHCGQASGELLKVVIRKALRTKDSMHIRVASKAHQIFQCSPFK